MWTTKLNPRLITTVFALGMCSTAFAGQIIYVEPDITGNKNGSPANFQPDIQYPSIQAAIEAAVDGDTIILAAGVFRGDGNRDLDFKGKAITVRSTDPNQPNIVATTIIDCNGTENEPHRGFYFHGGEDANSILAGVTIMNGYAEDGGGVYCESSSPTLRKCNFTRNLAQAFEDCSGGGMYNYRSSPTLVGCTFRWNSAFAFFHGGGSGGGMHNRDSSPTLTNCTFENNSTAWAGGGMRNSYYSTPTLSNCTFGGNSADDCGGGMDNDYHSNPTLTNCTFSGNSAAHGGGIHNDRVSPMLTNCSFSGNSASYSGGGMENYNDKYNQCSPTLINCTFANNRATMDGGGISNSRSNPTLTNCTLSGNSADHGAGMYNYFGSKLILTNCLFIGNTANNFGGGMSAIHNSSLELNNCTFALNSATNGNALACYHRHQQHLPSDVQMTNCILWDHGSEIWNNDHSSIAISYSDVQSGWPGEGNIDADPLFVDVGRGNYRLQRGSPCINAGDNSAVGQGEVDLDGQPRIVNDRVDMGAYELGVPQIIYVDDSADGDNDGSSWADAYNYLQDAFADANSSLEPVEIRVAQGVYAPDQGTDQHLEDRTATFQLRSGVAVKGGYPGFGAPHPDARNVEKYRTVLSGEISDDEDTCHVVTGSGADATAVLDGFTITAGRASSACRCFLGGGMYNYAGSPTVANCTFIGNWALDYGGGMCNDGNSCPLVMNCTFIGNSATDGGAVDNEYSNPAFKNCLFIGNWVDEYNADSFSGGAMYNFHSSPALINSTVYGNKVRQWWNYCGGIYNRGHDSRPTLTNCILWGNIDQYEDIQQAQLAGGLPIVNYCCIQGLKDDFPGNGNFGFDPLFARPGYWNNNDTPGDPRDDFWVDGDYYLKSQAGRWDPLKAEWTIDEVTSPCIDAGDPLGPIGLEPFPNGGIINIGAYGGTAEASKSYFGKPPCELIVAGDINGDCEINFRDFFFVALHWLEDINQ